MQQIYTHYGWIRSLRSLRLSVFLVVLLFIFVLANVALYMLAQKADTAQALINTQPVTVEEKVATEKETAPTEQSPAETSQPVVQAAPAPAKVAPKPARAALPAPSYDTVSIPSLGLSSRYVTVGLTSANAIDVHPRLVGWWNGSAQPGNPGAAFLDGHNPGVFSALPNIQIGAQITITKASGEKLNYTVVHQETVQLLGINMRKALSTHNGAAEGLNLMTCVGAYNPRTGTTDQRLVVYAVRS